MDLSRKSLKTFAKEKLKGRWGSAVAVAFVATIFGVYGAMGTPANSDQVSTVVPNLDPGVYSFMVAMLIVAFIWALLAFFVGPVIALGERTFFVGVCRGEPVKFSTLFSKMSTCLKAWCLNFMESLFIALWSFLFVIPGIIAYYRYFCAKYIMAEDSSVGVMEAINKSKAMMKGYKGKLFVLQLSFIGWGLLCGLTLGIGLLWLQPYMRTTETAFYLEIKKAYGEPGAVEAPVAPVEPAPPAEPAPPPPVEPAEPVE